METEWLIFNTIWNMRKKTRCTKFVGALTIECLRKELIKAGFNVSNRDSFIEGVPYELDLILAKKDKQPKENLVYNPDDVVAVLEIKFRGSYTKGPIDKIREVFASIKKANSKIECLYVAVSEAKGYKYRITPEKIGHDCFELFTRELDLEPALAKGVMKPTGDWNRLVSKIRKLAQ